jgi:hypothetical protein
MNEPRNVSAALSLNQFIYLILIAADEEISLEKCALRVKVVGPSRYISLKVFPFLGKLFSQCQRPPADHNQGYSRHLRL